MEIKKIRKVISLFIYPEFKKVEENEKQLAEKYSAMMKTDKVVIVSPMIEVKGLGKLKKGLFLQGDNLRVSGNVFYIKDSKNSALTIMGSGFQWIDLNYFNNTKHEKR